MSLNILMKDGKVYLDGEAEKRIAVLNEGETINIALPFYPPMMSREFRKLLQELEVPRYGPCIDCGNPAKGCHCNKCQQKRKQRAD